MKRMIRLAACMLALMTAVPAASMPAYAKTKSAKTKITAKRKSKKQKSKVKLQRKKLSYRMTYDDSNRNKYWVSFSNNYTEPDGLLFARSPDIDKNSDQTYLVGFDGEKELNYFTEKPYTTYLSTHEKKAKVTWTTSNKKVAYVKNSYQKGKQSRVLIHPASFGKCTITAKYKGKKYNIKVDVFKSRTRRKAEEALRKAGIKKDMPGVQKVALIARWCNRNFKYTTADSAVTDACEGINEVPALFTHRGRCQYLSRTFVFLCQLAGLTARVNHSDSNAHDWANIKLEDGWYDYETTFVGESEDDFNVSSDLFEGQTGGKRTEDALYGVTGSKYLDIPGGILADRVNTDEELEQARSDVTYYNLYNYKI